MPISSSSMSSSSTRCDPRVRYLPVPPSSTYVTYSYAAGPEAAGAVPAMQPRAKFNTRAYFTTSSAYRRVLVSTVWRAAVVLIATCSFITVSKRRIRTCLKTSSSSTHSAPQTRPAAARCPRQAGAAEPATPAGGPECCHRSLEGHLGSVQCSTRLSSHKRRLDF